MQDKKPAKLSRRSFLSLGVGTIGAVVGVSYLGLVGDFLNPPPAGAAPLQEVGKVADFAVNTPTLVSYQGDGIEQGVYVVNLGSEGWIAIDFHCTHLQCGINWVDSVGKFMCPCHGGVYDIKGNVLSGPPPRPLHRRVIQVQGDSVQVGGLST
ncbi:MAG: Rieske 2Fe-2S domain-containing protein [Peptococcaceae bacterium]|nr:Rieske 2Fe-2S domain-containing protein [Peptococcaceae bacterium]